jgi:hypothetical protein
MFLLGVLAGRSFNSSENTPEMLKPMAKEVMRAGASVTNKVKKMAVGLKEDLEDITAEALSESEEESSPGRTSRRSPSSVSG